MGSVKGHTGYNFQGKSIWFLLHSSGVDFLAWKIPCTEGPGGLQSTGSLGVGHDWATSLSCVGEGNGNPLQCSCLENPRDRGAWWAAVYGVAQSRTWLKQLSSSSSSSIKLWGSSKVSSCGMEHKTEDFNIIVMYRLIIEMIVWDLIQVEESEWHDSREIKK